MRVTTVCAFVLTRDRKELLVEGVRALLAQTRPVDTIVVFDNASGDGTYDRLADEGLLEDSRIHYHRSEINLGSAGGYARGLEFALAEGPDWIWTMDDDAEPAPDALERLLASPWAADNRTIALAGTVVRPDGTIETLHRCRLRRFSVPIAPSEYPASPVVDLCSFVGMLVRASAVRAAGLPRPEFFIAYDDAEWSLRLREHGAIRLIAASTMTHKIQMGGRSATRRSRLWNRLLGADYASASWSSYWKTLYGVRNFMAIKHRRGDLPLSAFAGLAAVYAVKAALYDERPWRAVPWVLRMAWRGRRGDFSGPTPAEWTAIAARS